MKCIRVRLVLNTLCGMALAAIEASSVCLAAAVCSALQYFILRNGIKLQYCTSDKFTVLACHVERIGSWFPRDLNPWYPVVTPEDLGCTTCERDSSAIP